MGTWRDSADPSHSQSKMTNLSSDVSKTSVLEREIKEKNAQIGRMRHEGSSCRFTGDPD